MSQGLAVRQGEPTSVIAQKNGRLLLNCSVEHDTSLGPLNITWQQDGGPVDIGNRIQLMSNGSLYFRRIIHRPKKSRTDEGQYDCLAALPNIGSIIARRVSVQVAGKDMHTKLVQICHFRPSLKKFYHPTHNFPSG